MIVDKNVPQIFLKKNTGNIRHSILSEIFVYNAEVRFIAINNDVDSANQRDDDFTPFLNIINEWYAKDTSKKIKAMFKAKGESAKPLCTTPPYGYKKDPEDKTALDCG